jgi:membrane dipeptidase
MRQLDFWKDGIVKSGNVKLVLKSSDIPKAPKPGDTPGCILAIEGGDPLAGNPDRVNEFYNYGVRLITLIHYSNNQLGDCMKNWRLNPAEEGGSRPRHRVWKRCGTVVVSTRPCDSQTLKQIAEEAKAVLDSHTNLLTGRFERWRTFRT